MQAPVDFQILGNPCFPKISLKNKILGFKWDRNYAETLPRIYKTYEKTLKIIHKIIKYIDKKIQ